MEFYKRLVIKILERSSLGEENKLLKKMKSGIDLTQKEMLQLEEIIENILQKLIETANNKNNCKCKENIDYEN